MAEYDCRGNGGENTKELTFYVVDDLQASVGGTVCRCDTMREAAARYEGVAAAHPDWAPSFPRGSRPRAIATWNGEGWRTP